MIFQLEKKKQEEKMRRDQLNDHYLNLIDKQRLYFKTVKDFKEVMPVSFCIKYDQSCSLIVHTTVRWCPILKSYCNDLSGECYWQHA